MINYYPTCVAMSIICLQPAPTVAIVWLHTSVAAARSTLSTPTPARPTTLSLPFEASNTCLVTCKRPAAAVSIQTSRFRANRNMLHPPWLRCARSGHPTMQPLHKVLLESCCRSSPHWQHLGAAPALQQPHVSVTMINTHRSIAAINPYLLHPVFLRPKLWASPPRLQLQNTQHHSQAPPAGAVLLPAAVTSLTCRCHGSFRPDRMNNRWPNCLHRQQPTCKVTSWYNVHTTEQCGCTA